MMFYLETTHQSFIDAHHTAGVVEFSAIVWRGEQGDQLTLRKEFVTVFDNLMRSAYQIHIVAIQESRHHIRAECEGNTSVVFAPSLENE